MLSINTNLNVLTSQVNKQKSQSAVDQVITRLSSGLRINSAKDDAAGLAIANRMEVNLRADAQISRGINDGIGLMQTAEGGLDEINHLIHRSRELAIQSANGTLSDSDRASINGEFTQIKEEIDRIARSTEIFGKYPLAQLRDNPPEPKELGNTPSISEVFPNKGTEKKFQSGIVPVAYIPKGATNIRIEIRDNGANDDIQVFTTKGEHLVGTSLEESSNNTWSRIKPEKITSSNIKEKVLTKENGFISSESYDENAVPILSGVKNTDGYSAEINEMNIQYSGDGNGNTQIASSIERYTESVIIDEAKEDLIFMVIGSGIFYAKADWDGADTPMITPPPNPPPNGEPLDIVMSANYGQKMQTLTIEPTPSDTKTLGIDKAALDPLEEAIKAIAKLDFALDKVDGYRGYYGSMENRFDSAITNLAQQQLNTSAAQSRIQDADYAIETANLARAQILQQTSTTILAQANQQQELALTLLKQ